MQLNPDFIDEVNKWCVSLSAEIEKSIAAGKKVYIIALSRKTPRFFEWLFEWLFQNGDSDAANQLVSLLKNPGVELTTEYAIPIIFSEYEDGFSSAFPNYDGIIVDDAIIFGATANRVCMEWAGASGRAPKYASIVRSSIGKIANLFIEKDINKTQALELEELKRPLHEISKCILKSSLPVDMEFPILHIKIPYGKIKDYMEQSADPSWRRYSLKSDLIEDSKESFTLMLDGEKFGSSHGRDFAKVRVFDKGEETVIEALSPYSLAIEDLHAKDFFGEESYDAIMRLVIEYVDAARLSPEISENEFSPYLINILNRYNARRRSTLIVWMNYLLSLSVFVKNMGCLVPKGVEARIDEGDVRLILGSNLAGRVTSLLNNILSEKIVAEEPADLRAALPIYKNPPELYDSYSFNVSGALSFNGNVDKNLDELFSESYFCAPLFEKMEQKEQSGHHVIGETYDSLKVHLNMNHYDDPDLEEKIHRWIDRRIDECRISPKYEVVIGSDHREYSRRFFLCGSNSIQ